MEQPTGNNKASAISIKTIIIIAAAVILAVIIAAVAVVSAVLLKSNEGAVSSSQPVIGYAADAKVILTQNELQEAWDRAMENAENGNIGLRYKNNAYSNDGINFKCLIANSDSNIYDMFLTIYADEEMTDQIFLSGLVPPGSGFENITLEHSLDVGDHTVYVALTQVKTDENGEQVIVGQAVHTVEFHVRGSASSTSE